MFRSVSSGQPDGERELRDQWVSDAANVPRGLAIFQPGAASATVDCPKEGEEIVCECLQVPLETVRACIARGLATQEELACETGVTTVCGGCTPRVSALLGVGSGFRVRLAEVRGISPGVRSFRFEPLDPARELRPALPGQHIVVSGTIRGRLVSRPYTLTSPAGEQEFHEISVKREPDGLFSMWLFSDRRPATMPSTSPSRGATSTWIWSSAAR
ncbi:MAG: (2Fe-2S)-binding protein [Gemmatimonadetes bacterium]|nr:(2Fe-2S)-binding protein [Gemmatimonadota bacterium]